ncbi:hypothetical protein ACFVU3_26985 [Streptomyces sp. NPDC058052]|uniref:hypothetical protein n=1 Tax=Streptomyces sp. NPDC058052 TaxID=3346316 RepID=UPI0036EEEF70
MASVVLVHGILNHVRGAGPEEAALSKAEEYRPDLLEGLGKTGLDVPEPDLVMAYYADLLRPPSQEQEQAAGEDLYFELLSKAERSAAAEWLMAAGAPAPSDLQNVGFAPLRQMLGWLVQERTGPVAEWVLERTVRPLERVVVGLLLDVEAYTTWPDRRRAVRERIANTIGTARPTVVVAHSLGSVATYETLLAFPDLEVELLVTVGSPLRLPTLARRLDPGLRGGRGARPAGVGRWVNIADVGDLVAIPPKLAKVFPVDQDEVTDIGLGIHGLGGYLANGLTASALAPYLS